MPAPPILDDVSVLEADAWLCDIWGVLHNGAAAIPGAAEACTAFRKAGGRVILVSNAPRPAVDVARQLAGLGITDASYDAILTSGDVTHAMLASEPPAPALHIGPVRHRVLFEGLDLPLADEADAGRIVCTGLHETSADEHPRDYDPLLERLAGRGLPMLCANPDIKVDAGGVITWCAGALAERYAARGGTVTHAGKPHAAIYATARRLLAGLAGRPIPDARLLAIGDGVETDIRGAASEGLRAVYVASRIHLNEPLTAASAGRLFEAHGLSPIAAMASLGWRR